MNIRTMEFAAFRYSYPLLPSSVTFSRSYVIIFSGCKDYFHECSEVFFRNHDGGFCDRNWMVDRQLHVWSTDDTIPC